MSSILCFLKSSRVNFNEKHKKCQQLKYEIDTTKNIMKYIIMAKRK
jgi:hypothetical protein